MTPLESQSECKPTPLNARIRTLYDPPCAKARPAMYIETDLAGSKAYPMDAPAGKGDALTGKICASENDTCVSSSNRAPAGHQVSRFDEVDSQLSQIQFRQRVQFG